MPGRERNDESSFVTPKAIGANCRGRCHRGVLVRQRGGNDGGRNDLGHRSQRGH